MNAHQSGDVPFVKNKKVGICGCTQYIEYEPGQAQVECKACGWQGPPSMLRGENAGIQAFLNENRKRREEDEKRRLAEQRLAEQRAQLNTMNARLGEIESSQHISQLKLEEIMQGMGVDRSIFLKLLEEMRAEQRTDKDALAYLLGLVLREQNHADIKLTNVQKMSQDILAAQNDAQAMLRAIEANVQHMQLKANADAWELQQLIGSFKDWWQEKEKRDALLTDKDKLQNSVEALGNEIAGFVDQWNADKKFEIEKLYENAEAARRSKKFKEAEEQYKKLIVHREFGETAEVYFRLLISHYGVVYTYSADQKKYVPTIYHPDLDSQNTEIYRQRLIDYCADNKEKEFYRAKLKEIDDILQEYRLLLQGSEYEYDVFISVKQSVKVDEKTEKFTADSELAAKLYKKLKNWGLKPFNSRFVNLPMGKNYEPRIIAALISARVMIVVGTCEENMNSDWVRNEWSRFQCLRDFDKNNAAPRKLFCCLPPHAATTKIIPDGLNPNNQALIFGKNAWTEL